MKFKSFLNNLLDFIYRKNCIICHSRKENTFLCSNCKNNIFINKNKEIKVIKDIKVYSCCDYIDIPKNLVKLLKFHKKKYLAEEIAKISYKYLLGLNIDFSDFEIVCVPLHKNKIKKRGFNQCELISTELSKLMDIPFNFNLIERVKNTKPMYRLKRFERKMNLENAFKVNKNNYHNKKILLLDDITTTGSTLEEIINELKNNDINNIICFTFTNTENIYKNDN